MDQYINLPYKNMGRDFNGVDCYGLAYLIFEEERGIQLPDFTDINYTIGWSEDGENYIVDSIYDKWSEVELPYQLFDCILFYKNANRSIVNHIGVYIGSNKFIHIILRKRSEINRLDKLWNNRIYKVLRFKGD
jgi:probable lipoprotein NlpC